MSYQIETKSRDHHLAVVSALWSIGFRPASMHSFKTPQEVANAWAISYPVVVIYEERKQISGNPSVLPQCGDVVTLDNLLDKLCKKDSITVELNSEYSAIVTNNGIKVGCQTFPLSIINKLVNAREQIQ